MSLSNYVVDLTIKYKSFNLNWREEVEQTGEAKSQPTSFEAALVFYAQQSIK
jgi:hypothetical protein